jgi:hypothetical protein
MKRPPHPPICTARPIQSGVTQASTRKSATSAREIDAGTRSIDAVFT